MDPIIKELKKEELKINEKQIDSIVELIVKTKSDLSAFLQYFKIKEKIYQALDTAARVNVFQRWVVDSSGVQYKPTQVSDTSIAIELKQMDYLTLAEAKRRYQQRKFIGKSSYITI